MGSLLEISICILIVRQTAEFIGKEDKRFEITVGSAIGVKKNPMRLPWPGFALSPCEKKARAVTFGTHA
jgi:hypothetical protein